MDTEALRWFQQVADGVTVTQVGELYWVTQSGVSRGLSRLEEEVGTPLLRRSGRTLRMTSAGAAFKRHVDALLTDLDDGLAAVQQLVDPETGTVGLAFQRSLGTWLVPHLVSTFRRDHPDIQFLLRQVRGEQVNADLESGGIDLELTSTRPTGATLRWKRLLTEPLRLAVPHGHRLARRAETSLAEAAGEGFVMLRPPSMFRRQCDELCQAAGFEPDIAIEADDLATARGLVSAGLGVAVVPAPRAGSPTVSDTALHHLSITDVHAVREIGLAWSTERRLLPAAELFRVHTVDQAAAGLLPPVG
jgi:LysR family transcriptional regulator, transcription activator of glutamate synthase operon